MTDLHKCMSILRPLIAEGDTNGIPAAEKAVNEYVAATHISARKEALQGVKQAVETHKQETPGLDLSFADTVNNYIEKLMRALE